MKAETLESLLIDRAMNELSPEAAELLDAYLAQNPAAAAGAAQLEDVVELAQQAVAETEEAPQRALATNFRADLRRESWLHWFRIPRVELVHLAACLTVGLALGLAVPLPWRIPATVSVPSPKPTVTAKAEVDHADRSSAQFWSLTAVAADRQTRSGALSPAQRDRLQWDSLFKMPRLEEN
jgi:anti-sigma factor RsiW